MAYIQQINESTERSPAAPAIVRSNLPDMPQRCVHAAGKNFETPILIGTNSEQINLAAQRGPATPAIVGRNLPDVPQSLVIHATRKNFQTAILISAHGQHINASAAAVPP